MWSAKKFQKHITELEKKLKEAQAENKKLETRINEVLRGASRLAGQLSHHEILVESMVSTTQGCLDGDEQLRQMLDLATICGCCKSCTVCGMDVLRDGHSAKCILRNYPRSQKTEGK